MLIGTIRRYPMLLPLGAVVLAGVLLSESFMTFENITNVARQLTVVGVAALGSTLVIITGGIDLSVGPLIGLVGVELALTQKLPLLASLLLAVGLGGFWGFLNGVLISRVNLPPFIVTFGMGSVATGLALGLSGGWPLFMNIPLLTKLGMGNLWIFPIPFVIFVTLALITHWLLNETRFGVNLFGIGQNREAVRLAGVNVSFNLITTYTLAGLLTAVSALVAAGRSSAGDPSIGMPLSFDVIGAVVVGGTRIEGGSGGIWQTIIGTFFIGLVTNIMNLMGIVGYYQILVRGGVVILAVVLSNLYGLLELGKRASSRLAGGPEYET